MPYTVADEQTQVTGLGQTPVPWVKADTNPLGEGRPSHWVRAESSCPDLDASP